MCCYLRNGTRFMRREILRQDILSNLKRKGQAIPQPVHHETTAASQSAI